MQELSYTANLPIMGKEIMKMFEQIFVIGMVVVWYFSMGLSIRFLAHKIQACDILASIGFILFWPMSAPIICMILAAIDGFDFASAIKEINNDK